MRERPILFTPANRRAIREGRKWQTRRIVKPQPHLSSQKWGDVEESDSHPGEWFQWHDGGEKTEAFTCPYGAVGDRLWLKEGWRVGKPHEARNAKEIWDHLTTTQKGVTVLYESGGWKSTSPMNRPVEPTYPDNEPMPSWAGRRRSSLFMPKWAARTWLEITDVRVERLSKIAEADAIAEGIAVDRVITDVVCYGGPPIETYADRAFFDGGDDEGYEDAVTAYSVLWDKINGKKYPWSSDSFVWVLGFKQI